MHVVTSVHCKFHYKLCQRQKKFTILYIMHFTNNWFPHVSVQLPSSGILHQNCRKLERQNYFTTIMHQNYAGFS
jgi:hypothetical protein